MSQSPELASVAKMLQEAAQTLLSLIPQDETESPQGEPEEDAEQDEYRTYRVPFHILDDEEILLKTYEAERIADALAEIYNEFYLLLELLKGHSENTDSEGFLYFLFTQHLSRPLKMLSKASSVLADFQRQPEES